MTTPTTQREADERAQKALAAITERLALTYRICCGTSPKQSVGELLDVTINMPEWEIVRAAIDQSTRQAAPEAPAAATDQPSAGLTLPKPREPHSSEPRDQAHAAGWNACLEAVRASLTPTAHRPVEVAGLGRITNEDDGYLTLQFKDEDAAQAFMESYHSSVEVDEMPPMRPTPTAPQAAAPSYWNSQRKMIERAIIGLRDGWATRKDADDALAALSGSAPQAASVSGERCYACRGCGHEVVGGRAVGICDVCKGTGSAPQAASQQAETVVGASETGWLIEVKGFQSPLWLKADGSTTADANDALRFGREQDASAFLSVFLTAKCGDDAVAVYKRRLGADCYTVTEHIWHSAAAPQAATTASAACTHEFYYFGDQVSVRRCLHCNKLEDDATTASPRCTCPSGDGSLRWPCPAHPPEDTTASASTDADLDYLLEYITNPAARAACQRKVDAIRAALARAPLPAQAEGTAKRLRDLAAGRITGEIPVFEYSLAADRIQDLEGLLEQAKRATPVQAVDVARDAARWSKEPPTEQADYWHWDGDEDHAPMIYHVLWSGTAKKCFVSIGQYGIDEAIWCDNFGGYWMKIKQPSIRTNTTGGSDE